MRISHLKMIQAGKTTREERKSKRKNQKEKGFLCFPNQTTIIGGICLSVKNALPEQEVVDWFVKKKLIYETRRYHNVVFIGRDSFGTARFASMRGTVDNYGNPFKGTWRTTIKPMVSM